MRQPVRDPAARAAYARERLEEVIRAIAEDALSPSRPRRPAVARRSRLRGRPRRGRPRHRRLGQPPARRAPGGPPRLGAAERRRTAGVRPALARPGVTSGPKPTADGRGDRAAPSDRRRRVRRRRLCPAARRSTTTSTSRSSTRTTTTSSSRCCTRSRPRCWPPRDIAYPLRKIAAEYDDFEAKRGEVVADRSGGPERDDATPARRTPATTSSSPPARSRTSSGRPGRSTPSRSTPSTTRSA